MTIKSDLSELKRAYCLVSGRHATGSDLREAREAIGYSPAQLAHEIGKSEGRVNLLPSAVVEWELSRDLAPYWFRYALRDLVLREMREVERAA
jgi:hypothetical protein